MKLFETHCHLDFPNYKKDRHEVIKNCLDKGVEYFINVGIDTDTIKAGLELAKQYPQMRVAAGYHPNYADKFDAQALKKFLSEPKVVALGEIGLDYYRKFTDKNLQKEVFEKQVIIGKEAGLPLIIHDRDAHKDCWKILTKHNPEKVVFHCFAGDIDFANQIWEQGWHISVTAVVTYKNCRVNDVLAACPVDKLMTETDCPFMAPQHKRGKRNDPSSLVYVVNRLSEIKSIPPMKLADTLYQNAYDFFIKKA